MPELSGPAQLPAQGSSISASTITLSSSPGLMGVLSVFTKFRLSWDTQPGKAPVVAEGDSRGERVPHCFLCLESPLQRQLSLGLMPTLHPSVALPSNI